MKSTPGSPTESDANLARTDPSDVPDDPRLMQAVQEYLQQLEAGRQPDRQEILARYPDLAAPLARCLEGLDLVHQAAMQPRRSTSRSGGAAGRLAAAAVGGSEAIPTNPLGDFMIVREIGRGGMGIVYEAVQLSLGRRVALKVLPLAATLDPKYLQRFHHEAQAAALLHHTNIVPVYAVGCERGVHFYAMQLIQGQALDEVVRQLRRQSGRVDPKSELLVRPAPPEAAARSQDTVPAQTPPAPRPGASSPDAATPVALALSTQRSANTEDFFRTLARFIVQAAEALEYAHQFGIIHRDIKPANLLVDVYGRLWITDFGLAQFHADANLTRTGEIIGTVRYMSPEQASGQRVLLDHRTDVYSLGATLYELSTLEPIFIGRTRHELSQQILHDEPRLPRSIDPAVPIELETIILKAVSKVPAERYGSARELAADLQRYLEDRPILARRPSLLDRARKWTRRHPGMLRAAVVLLVFLAAGSLVSTWLIRTEQNKTREAYRQERERAEEAEKQFRLAQRAVDEMIRLAEEELSDNPFLQDLRKRVLESALTYYQEFCEQRRDDPNAQATLAATRDRVNKFLSDLAVLQGAGQLALLADAGVLDDLQPSEAQRERIAELSHQLEEQRRASFRLFHRLSSAERRERFVELARANEAAVEEILTPRQLGRFRQIALQLQGAAAFRDTEVTRTLELTAEQKKQLRAIETDPTLRTHSWRPGANGIEARKTQAEARAAAEKRIESVLTAKQMKRWRQMTGEPFKGSVPGPPPQIPPPSPPAPEPPRNITD
jgi:serine/threonine protein kinase